MPQRNGAAVHIDTGGIPRKSARVRDRLRRERLVRFDQIVVADLRTGLCHQLLDGYDRREEEILRLATAGCVTGDAGEYLELVIDRELLADDDHCRGAIIQRRCVAGRHAQLVARALDWKRRTQLRQRFDSGVLARAFVRIYDGRALATRDLDWNDLG